MSTYDETTPDPVIHSETPNAPDGTLPFTSKPVPEPPTPPSEGSGKKTEKKTEKKIELNGIRYVSAECGYTVKFRSEVWNNIVRSAEIMAVTPLEIITADLPACMDKVVSKAATLVTGYDDEVREHKEDYRARILKQASNAG